MESDGPFRLFLSQVCPTEEAGLYTLRARVMSFGGLNEAAMIVKDYGGPDLDVAIPTSKTWTQITIPNIRCEGASARGTPFDPCVFPDFDFQSQTLKAPPFGAGRWRNRIAARIQTSFLRPFG
jgi:hypothetical protein